MISKTGNDVRVAVIGAGIGGITLALLLEQKGFRVLVYEQAQEAAEVGAGICIFPNGMRVLNRLGLGRRLELASAPFDGFRLCTASGRLLKRVKFPRQDASGIAIHRGDLYRALRGAFTGEVRLSHRCIGLIDASGRPRFANGHIAEGDVFIGADGYDSSVRQALFPGTTPQYRGYVEWRGVAEMDRRGELNGDLVELQGHGVRFGLFTIGEHRTAWWITSNEPADATVAPRGTRDYLKGLDGWGPIAMDLLDATPADAVIRTPLFDLDPLDAWHRDGTCLLGDAAHPATPNLGQGASMAIEDAAILASCLERRSADLSECFAAYERERKARTALVQKVARSIGETAQWSHPLAVWAREALVRATPAGVLFGTTFRLQEYTPELRTG